MGWPPVVAVEAQHASLTETTVAGRSTISPPGVATGLGDRAHNAEDDVACAASMLVMSAHAGSEPSAPLS